MALILQFHATLPLNYLDSIPKKLRPKLNNLMDSIPCSKNGIIYGFIGSIVFVASPYYDCSTHKFNFMIWTTSVSITNYYDQNSFIVELILQAAFEYKIQVYYHTITDINQQLSFITLQNELSFFFSQHTYSSSSQYKQHSVKSTNSVNTQKKPVCYKSNNINHTETLPAIHNTSLKPTTAPGLNCNSSKAILHTSINEKTSVPTELPDISTKSPATQKSKYHGIYAIITVSSENLYTLFLVSNKSNIDLKEFHLTPAPVVLDEEHDKEFFTAAIYSIKNQIPNFAILIQGRIIQYKIVKTIYTDRKYFLSFSNNSLYKVDSTDKIFPVIVYNGTNGCFRKRHPTIPCNAIVSTRTAKQKATLKVFKCLDCNKYFVTSQVIKAQGGYNKLYIRIQFDPSCSKSDYDNIYGPCLTDDIFNDFAPSTSFHDDGYTTRKSDYERHKILAYFIDSGLHPKDECIAYLQNYTARNLYGENATQKALNDLNFVLQYDSDNDETINGELKRKN